MYTLIVMYSKPAPSPRSKIVFDFSSSASRKNKTVTKINTLRYAPIYSIFLPLYRVQIFLPKKIEMKAIEKKGTFGSQSKYQATEDFSVTSNSWTLDEKKNGHLGSQWSFWIFHSKFSIFWMSKSNRRGSSLKNIQKI